jgi:DnaJ-class molecular chaperone
LETVLWLLGGGTFAAALVGYHLTTYNRRECGRCKGTGKHRSWIFFWRYQKCGKCNGSGEVRGWFGRTL